MVTNTQARFVEECHTVLAQRKLVQATRHIQAASRKGKLRVMGLFTAKMVINSRVHFWMGCPMVKSAVKDLQMAAPSLVFSHLDTKMGLVY
jgi:hypothetical protein